MTNLMTSQLMTSQLMTNLMLNWDLGSFLENATTRLKDWGGLFIVLIGVVMIVVGVFQIGSGLMSGGKKQVNWFIAIALLIIGGALMVGGWGFVSKIAGGGKKTIEDLGTGATMIPFFFK